MDLNLRGRRALITGSVQGIGFAVAESLAAEHCHIMLHGLGTPEQFAEAAAQLAKAGALSVTSFTHNLRDPEQVVALMREVLHERAPQLPVQGGAYADFAADTEDALASGCEGAALALIESSRDAAQHRLGQRPTLLLHGGGAQFGRAPGLLRRGLAAGRVRRRLRGLE